MTYDEYKKLVEEYDSTDSVSRRGEIEEKVFEVSVALARKLEGMYNKFGESFIKDDDYRSDSGGFSIEDFDKIRVYLIYSDHWKYGGECRFGVSVPMNMLDVENRIAKMRSLRDKQIENLQKEHYGNELHIGSLKKKNEEILEKIAQLEHERANDPGYVKPEVPCEKEGK